MTVVALLEEQRYVEGDAEARATPRVESAEGQRLGMAWALRIWLLCSAVLWFGLYEAVKLIVAML